VLLELQAIAKLQVHLDLQDQMGLQVMPELQV
jgi:hypothetical protein